MTVYRENSVLLNVTDVNFKDLKISEASWPFVFS